LTYNSYTSNTPDRRHPWHNEAFGDILGAHQAHMNYKEKMAAQRQEQIEQEKVRLRIAKVDQLYSKRCSIPGISEAMGISQEQVEEDLNYMEQLRSQQVQAHTAAIQQQDEEELTDEEKEIREEFWLGHGFVRPKSSKWSGEGAYVANFV
jgi:hypothetical protein